MVTLLKLNLKILPAVSLQEYFLGVLTVATLERGLDTGRWDPDSRPSPEIDWIDQMISGPS